MNELITASGVSFLINAVLAIAEMFCSGVAQFIIKPIISLQFNTDKQTAYKFAGTLAMSGFKLSPAAQ